MKRIDLVSKLVAPIFISFVLMATNHTLLALTVAAMNLILFFPEWVCAKSVWTACPKLKEPRLLGTATVAAENEDTIQAASATTTRWTRWMGGLHLYFGHDVWRRTCLAAITLARTIR